MRAVGYIRVSDVSQVDGHSLNAQERLFWELCKSRGWEPIKIYREEGVSAHSDAIAKRPQFRQLLDDATKGQFDVVVVHTLDGWARNLRVQLEAISILSRHGIGFISITENIDYSTAQGRLQAQIPCQPHPKRAGSAGPGRKTHRRNPVRVRLLQRRAGQATM